MVKSKISQGSFLAENIFRGSSLARSLFKGQNTLKSCQTIRRPLKGFLQPETLLRLFLFPLDLAMVFYGQKKFFLLSSRPFQLFQGQNITFTPSMVRSPIGYIRPFLSFIQPLEGLLYLLEQLSIIVHVQKTS